MNNTKRTPPSTPIKQTATSTENLINSPILEIAEPADNPNKKRKADTVASSNVERQVMGDDMKKFLETMSQTISQNVKQDTSKLALLMKRDMGSLSQSLKQDIGTVCTKVDRVELKIGGVELKVDEMREEVTKQINHLHAKLADTNDMVMKNSEDVTNIKWQLNELEQMNLAARMDITGVEEEQVIGDIKDVAISAIRSCGIAAIKTTDIVAAFARKPKGYEKPIITAIFISAERKSEIMRIKLANKKPTTIYFGHTMTPATRTIFRRAKIMAKAVGAKTVYVSGGKVVVAFEGGRKIWVSSEADIAGYELPERREEVEPEAEPVPMLT